MATAATSVTIEGEIVSQHSNEARENSDFRQVAVPSNTIIFQLDASRGEKVSQLARMIQTNDYGLPLYYIRSDLVDWTRIDSYGHISYDEIEQAGEILDYEQGYPCLRKGSPFWTQLPHEPHQSYILFQEFLALDEHEGIRLLDTLAKQQQVPLENIREISLEYFWSARARSYDLFIVAAEAKKRETRTRKTENSHFSTAAGILDEIINRINTEPALIKDMSGPDLFDLFEKMVKIQRLSLGLTGSNASTNQQLPMNPGGTVEMILRTLTKDNGLSEQAGENIQQRLAALMGDEETALRAQELVIRATTSNEVYSGT
jgi:hypothetical protein